MLLFNSNGLEAVVNDDKVSWRVTGGVLDLFIFPGPNPMQARLPAASRKLFALSAHYGCSGIQIQTRHIHGILS